SGAAGCRDGWRRARPMEAPRGSLEPVSLEAQDYRMGPSARKREASPHPYLPPQAEDGWRLTATHSPDPSDINVGDWVDRWLPGWADPYARLARWDRPIGTWLLLFPGWWGIALAGPRWPDPVLLVLFAIGAVAMRGAGCTLND